MHESYSALISNIYFKHQVKPDEIDDVKAMRMARDVTKKIKESMEYPGQIKVIVIRETRAVEYAK